ncbi:sugar phosphate isomerase/epimerase [Candidatus Bathyarchaeota archaeon]|nr:sugar phosphate isomerase/epimerase [Candidatus Bathyarchaeota archaeon]
MEIGISNHPLFNLNPIEFFKLAKKLEVNRVEIKLDDLRFKNFLLNERKLNDFNFKLNFHLPVVDVNLGTPHKDLRGSFEKILFKSMFLVKKVNAEIVVCHAGRLNRVYPKALLPKVKNETIESLKKLFKTSENLGVTFTLENDRKAFSPSLAGDLNSFQEMLNKIECKATLDIGHANTFSNPIEFIKNINHKIINIHIHDNNGDKDEHLPLGKGKINFKEILASLKEVDWSGSLIIEAHNPNDMIESLNNLRNLIKTFQ